MIEKTTVTIPIYDETENLSDIIYEVLTQAPSVGILIIDDNSPGGTRRLAEELGTKDPHIHVLHRQEKSGLGPAYLAALTWTSERDYIWVGEFDANESHRLQGLPRLLAMARGITRPDLVIKSHWIRGGGTRGRSRKRELFNHTSNFYVNITLGLQIHDITAGFRIYHVDFLDRLLRAVNIESRGYGFQIEMIWRTRRAAGQIKEVPTIFVERRAGTSKMSDPIIQEAFVKVLRWRASESLHRGS